MTTVHGLKREHGKKLFMNGSSRIWFCDGCGSAFTWDEHSAAYGSLKDIEAGNLHRVWIACSSECRDKMPSGFPKGVKR